MAAGIAVGIARWLFTLLGGVLVGTGIVLHGQLAVARVMRAEVDNTFFLWRAVGHATIFLQGDDVRVALALKEIPDNVLKESDRAAWTMVIVGALLAITAPLLRHRPLEPHAAAVRPPRSKRAAKPPAKSPAKPAAKPVAAPPAKPAKVQVP